MNTTVLEAMKQYRITAILRGIDREHLEPVVEALYAGGIRLLEITFNQGSATRLEDTAAAAVKAAAQQEIQGVTVSLAEARSFIESGDLVCLGIMDAERNSLMPDVPTCAEQGYDIFYATQRGMALPKGCSDEVREKLQAACVAAIEDPEFVETMASLGQAISFMNAEEYTAYLEQAAIDVPAAMVTVGLIEE